MRELLARIHRAVKRRPVRVAEAATALAAVAGVTLAPEVEEGITVLVVAVLAVVGGEAAQRYTTSTSEPRLPDGHDGDADPDETA